MKLLFVKSNKLGSRLIRWGLKADCSHFAVCFDEQAAGSGIVFESTPSGAHLTWFGLFRKKQTIVHALSFKRVMTLEEEEAIYQGILAQYSGQGYDWGALAYWVFRVLLLRIFGTPLPNRNKWAKSRFSLCTGIAEGVPWIKDWARDSRYLDLEMLSPQQLCLRLMGTREFVYEKDWIKQQQG